MQKYLTYIIEPPKNYIYFNYMLLKIEFKYLIKKI